MTFWWISLRRDVNREDKCRKARCKEEAQCMMENEASTTTTRLSFIIDIKMIHILFIIPSWLHAAPLCTTSKWNEKKLIKSFLSLSFRFLLAKYSRKTDQSSRDLPENLRPVYILVNNDDDNVIRHYNFDFALLVYRRWANIQEYIKIC